MLTRQLNLSETTFLLPLDKADGRYAFFTTSYEMRFAPALRLAQVLRELLGKGDRLTLEFKAAVVNVAARGNVWNFIALASGMPTTRATALDDDFIARMVGLTLADAVRRAQLAGDFLDQWPVSSLGRKTAYVFAFTDEHDRGTRMLARYFFTMQGGGVGEDPGTGSACANLGGWLIATGRQLPCNLQIRQGEAVGHECMLQFDVTAGKKIHAGGKESNQGAAMWIFKPFY